MPKPWLLPDCMRCVHREVRIEEWGDDDDNGKMFTTFLCGKGWPWEHALCQDFKEVEEPCGE